MKQRLLESSRGLGKKMRVCNKDKEDLKAELEESRAEEKWAKKALLSWYGWWDRVKQDAPPPPSS